MPSQGPPLRQPWHALSTEETLARLGSDPGRGLSPKAAGERALHHGPNSLDGDRPPGLLAAFAAQFANFMVLILVAAAFISLALGELADCLTILAIVVLNAVLGTFQNYRAERALQALKDLTAPTARVVRAGRVERVPAGDLVPGDIVLLEAGDRVPADLRLVKASALEADESPLTGESLPVEKRADVALGPTIPLGDRSNLLFTSTTVTRGTGRGVVVATGMDTELGQIAGMLGTRPPEATPLERRLHELGRLLVAACLLVCVLVVLAGLSRGEPFAEMFLAGVSLAVAAIPEGLPAVVTIALAVGVQRMARRQAIVRRLPAVETLGCATVICADKTGTLTENEMALRELHPWGPVTLAVGLLCSNARLDSDLRRAEGDPTEAALVVAAAAEGLTRERLERAYPRRAEFPFEPERRRMSTLHSVEDLGVLASLVGRPGGGLLLTKGAADTVLHLCSSYQRGDRRIPLGEGAREQILGHNEELAGRGLRVLALAYRPLPVLPPPTGDPGRLERELCFLALAGLSDPPRKEVFAALRVCRRAGIRPIMVTGDHPATARAIGRELGLLGEEDPVLTGDQLDRMDERELVRAVRRTSIFARVSPAHKLQIVRALRSRSQVVAMTGDGVNDAPALREADIGVAMGQTGTDVTREAADMVLGDDNFASIVAAIVEGRGIYDNIRKFVRYLLSCNIGEILVMLLGAVLRQPLPLLPVQILWVNLATDGLPAIALGLGAPGEDVTGRPPRPPGESVFANRLGIKIAGRGLLIGLSSLGVFLWGRWAHPENLPLARTLCLATLVLAQLFHAFDCRSERRSVFEMGLLANPYLVGAVLCSGLMLAAVIYLPALQPVFRTHPLGIEEWPVVLVAAALGQILVGLRRALLYGGRSRYRKPERSRFR
ncbi:MAG: cation-translocating P-type ATPase [bacterium]|nr:cation-translocating P-type ATPase [bacterium]